MKWGAALSLALFTITACARDAAKAPAPESERDRIVAVAHLNDQYAESSISGWKVQAEAAGADCRVLIVHITGTVADDTMIEALHYGGGHAAVTPGGLRGFARDHGFRGIAYFDASPQKWASGDLRRRADEEPWDVGAGIHVLTPRDADMALGRIPTCN